MKLATLILAGGEGRRMNGDKPFKQLGGQTLLARTANYARRLGFPVALSLRSPEKFPIVCHLPIVQDRLDIEGPLAGVAAGLEWASQSQIDAVLTVPIDMPWLPDDLACRLVEEGEGHAAFATSGGQAYPVCALWPVSKRKTLQNCVGLGHNSLRGCLESLDARAVVWSSEERDLFANINDPAALAEAERVFQKSR